MTSRAVAGGAFLGAAALFAAVLIPEPAYSHKPITTNILFKNEIAQIFQRKCFQCHSENNLAMSLTTYTDARPWARAIREEILDREMPPWQAVAGYGHFANDISLNTREKEIILSWTDGGAPSGVLRAEESLPPVYVAAAPAWDHGEPDLVLPINGGHTVTSGAPFEIKRFVVETKLPAAKRVRGIALKQGDRRVVRHAAFYEEPGGRWIGGWTPWQTLSQFADGASVTLPANARVAVEIGFTGADEDVTDKSEIGFYFAEEGGVTVSGMRIDAPPSPINAGTTAHRVRVESKMTADAKLLAFWPNPGEGARSIEVMAVSPDGMSTPLLWINDYRAEWRSPYMLTSAVDVPRGSRLIMTTYFDNTGAQSITAKPQMWIATEAASRPVSVRRK
jgi:hypothetical protein